MLSVDDATRFVIERGLVDHAWVIDGDLTVRCVARRNRNLRAEGPGGAGYLIKQPDDPAVGAHRTLRAEAAFYNFCQGETAVPEMARIAPRLVYCDPEHALLVVELVAGAESLLSYYQALDAQGFPVEASGALGFALGTVHRVFRHPNLLEDPRLAWLERNVPWVLMVHRLGPEVLANLSPANVQMIRIFQSQEGLAGRFVRLRQCWWAETVIHGDIRADNILVWRPGEAAALEVRIVDWELVQYGDPAWDLAGALQNFVEHWVNSMSLSAEVPAEDSVAQARYPLENLQAAIGSLWQGYQAAAVLSASDAEEVLKRAVQFSAARIIQNVYESSYESQQLSAQSVILLQISENLLTEPERGQVHLYGIPLSPSPQ
jgi:Phosphotransferase enzyme family